MCRYIKIFLKKDNISAPDILLLNIMKYVVLPISYSAFWFQIQKGKVHGSIDVGLSVMSIKKKARRIDLDTEEHIYHLKVKSDASVYSLFIHSGNT